MSKRCLYCLAVVLAVFFLLIEAKSELSSGFEGKYFLVGYMQNEINIDSFLGLTLALQITSRYNAQIRINTREGWSKNFTIAADSVLVVFLTPESENRTPGEAVQKATEIISDVDITVQCYSSQYTSSDAFTALPVSRWGTSYAVLSYPNDQYYIEYEMEPEDSLWSLEPRSSEFMVIAAEDGTEVEFSPKAETREGYYPGNLYKLFLNKGDCYLVQAAPTGRGTGDLTGTMVYSNKPIGFLSGHVRTAIPQTLMGNYDTKDFLCEMLVPIERWGRNYASVPFGFNSDGDYFRVIAADSNTYVSIKTQSGTYGLFFEAPGPGSYYLNEPAIWKSNKPVQIGQFMSHSGTSHDNRYYDPSFVVLPPSEQRITKASITTFGNYDYFFDQYDYYWLNIIADSAGAKELTLNGNYLHSMTPFLSQKLPGDSLFWVTVRMNKGKYELNCSAGSFSAIGFANGWADSYSLVIGSSLIDKNYIDVMPPYAEVERCEGLLEGTAFDFQEANMSGVDFVEMVESQSYNYVFETSGIGDSSMTAQFKAMPRNFRTDAHLVFLVSDRAGNTTRYEWDYKGINPLLPDFINMPAAFLNDSSKSYFYIKNKGSVGFEIKSKTILYDERLEAWFEGAMPITVEPGDSALCVAVFKPGMNLSQLNSAIVFDFDCDRYDTVLFQSFVLNAGLSAQGKDFGTISVGEIACDTIYIFNVGNAAVTLDSIVLDDPKNAFYIDTSGIFPHKLEPGDTLALIACFVPDSAGDFSASFIVINDLTLSCGGSLTGAGADCRFNEIYVDFGKHRLATRTDKTIVIKNSGTSGCSISYYSRSGDTLSFDDVSLRSLSSMFFDIDDSIVLNVAFIPEAIGTRTSVIQLVTNSIKTDTINITLTGVGSLPVISTSNADFDSITVYTTKEDTFAIITSLGNEKLSLRLLSTTGDVAAFAFNEASLNNVMLEPDSILKLPMSFSPVRLGPHTMTMTFEHDANPANQWSSIDVLVTGFSLPADTLDYVLQLIGGDSLLPCNAHNVSLELTNTGNVPVTLDSIAFTGGLSANVLPDFTFPVTVEPVHSVLIPISLIVGSATDSILLKAFCAQTEARYFTYIVAPKPQKIILDSLIGINAVPGDSVNIHFSGSMPYSVEIPVAFSFEIEIPQSCFYLLDTSTSLNVTKGSIQKKYSATATQTKDLIKILPDTQIDFSGSPAYIEISLALLPLLCDKEKINYAVTFSPENCYYNSRDEEIAEIARVCVQSLRLISVMPDEYDLWVRQNPAKDKIDFNVYLPEDNRADIELYDLYGKKITLAVNLYLKKGIQNLIFENSGLTCGTYLICVRFPHKFIGRTLIITTE
jgi:hypothetical protein